MRSVMIAACAALLLEGCSMVPYYPQLKAVADTGISTAIEDRQSFNDKKLSVNLSVLCDSSIGAVNRHPNAEVRGFVNRLCGGDPAITMDQLSRTMDLLSAASGAAKPITLPPVPEDFQ